MKSMNLMKVMLTLRKFPFNDFYLEFVNLLSHFESVELLNGASVTLFYERLLISVRSGN